MIGDTFFHYLGVLFGSSLPETQTTEAERALLRAHLPQRKRIVEIGVFEGFTTRVLTEGSDADAMIYGVDPFFAGRFGISWGLGITSAYNHEAIKSGKLKLIRSMSTEVGAAAPSSVDFVFIDGDHSLEGIKSDWAFWSERLANGGIVGLHDTVPTPKGPEFGSHQYYRGHIKHDQRFDLVAQQDSLAVLRKR